MGIARMMPDPKRRLPEEPGVTTDRGGENVPPPTDDEKTHTGAPHNGEAHEPLGPLTPDDETPLGDTPEAHDEIIPEDLPKDHPGRREAERMAQEDGVVRGNT